MATVFQGKSFCQTLFATLMPFDPVNRIHDEATDFSKEGCKSSYEEPQSTKQESRFEMQLSQLFSPGRLMEHSRRTGERVLGPCQYYAVAFGVQPILEGTYDKFINQVASKFLAQVLEQAALGSEEIAIDMSERFMMISSLIQSSRNHLPQTSAELAYCTIVSFVADTKIQERIIKGFRPSNSSQSKVASILDEIFKNRK